MTVKLTQISPSPWQCICSVFLLHKQEINPNTLPLYPTVRGFLFFSCHNFSFRLFPFQANVLFSHRLAPIHSHLSVLHGSQPVMSVGVWVCPPFSFCPSAGRNRQLSLTIWLESWEFAIGCRNLPLCSATHQAATTNPNNSFRSIKKNKGNQIIPTRSFQYFSKFYFSTLHTYYNRN
jgi:hypothetical protein